MPDTFRIKLSSGERIEESRIDIVIAKAAARNQKIKSGHMLCAFGCGRRHPLSEVLSPLGMDLIRQHNKRVTPK